METTKHYKIGQEVFVINKVTKVTKVTKVNEVTDIETYYWNISRETIESISITKDSLDYWFESCYDAHHKDVFDTQEGALDILKNHILTQIVKS